MFLRAIIVVPLASLLLIISSADSPFARQPALSLQVEALTRDTLAVRVSFSPLGSERRRVQSQETLLITPFTVSVPDSTGRIHIVVQGYRSVRAILTTGLASQDSIVSEGRDITLARKANGRFQRVWTAQHLLP